MSKIKLNVFLSKDNKVIINNTYSGILRDNIIKYSDGYVNLFDIDNCLLRRKSNDYEILLDFSNSTAICKYSNYELPISIKIINSNINDETYSVKYALEDSIFIYKIKWR